MAEELKTILVPVTDGTVTKYEETYVLSEFNLVHGGTGNATVPNDAAIQPAQAFVDNIGIFWGFTLGNNFSCQNKGITSLGKLGDGEGGLYDVIHVTSTTGSGTIHLSGNAITNVDDILASMHNLFNAYAVGGFTLDLSGGTNAEPTNGASNEHIAPLVAGGWTLILNINGVPTTFP